MTEFLWKTAEMIEAMAGRPRGTMPKGIGGISIDSRSIAPGDQAEIGFELAKPVGIEPGVRFAMREGGRTVGAGIVTGIDG